MKNKTNCFLKHLPNFHKYYKLTDSIHRLIVLFSSHKARAPLLNSPNRLLLSNCGGIGDLIMCSGVIAEIRRQFPVCKIGFIVSKYSKIALENLPSIDWVYVVDYPYLEKGNSFRFYFNFLKFVFFEQRKLTKQVKREDYDCAIELRAFYPNLIPVFWKANIPLRIGFTSGGNSKLLNVAVSWSKDQYTPHCYSDLLRKVGIEINEPNSLIQKFSLKPNRVPIVSQPYVIFHLCSSIASKDLPIEFWQSLYKKCKEQNYSIYFTGKGERDSQAIHQVIKHESESFCNKLEWQELVHFVNDSQGIVSVDSAPVHLAAALNVNCAVLFSNTLFPKLWSPNIPICTSFGIEAKVEVDEVFSLIKKWMQSSEN